MDGPRILLIDIETFPVLMYAWQTWDATALKIVEPTSIASFSAKWLGGKQMTRCLADYKGYKPGSRNDKKLVADLWKLLDEADWVVAHNGDRFDVKKVNYRLSVHGFGPPSPYVTIDTLKESRAVQGPDSHRLNERCREHKIGQKVRTGGKDLWFDCIEGNMKAWQLMKKYNAADVYPLLEGWYLQLRPWMKRHPAHGMFTDRPTCPKCGSHRVQARGTARNRSTAYRRWFCPDCGAWAKGTAIKRNTKPLVAV